MEHGTQRVSYRYWNSIAVNPERMQVFVQTYSEKLSYDTAECDRHGIAGVHAYWSTYRRRSCLPILFWHGSKVHENVSR